MEKTCNYDICTACGVCSTVCPKGCISFEVGNNGHVHPKIDQSKCIDCNKCRRVCPSINEFGSSVPSECFAAIIKNPHDYASTTSGGAAQALSLLTLIENGVVYGCASLPGAQVKHIKVETASELEKLKGSKYVISYAWEIYADLVKEVKGGRKVLFIGTPCQVAAVKKLMGKDYDNLLLVDIICHGVPSQQFLHSWLKKKGCEIKDINKLRFRTEKGYQLIVSHLNNDGSTTTFYESAPMFQNGSNDLYYKCFLAGYSFRGSCYNCRFAKPERISDITIGDFWGLGKEASTENIPPHEKGISVILVSSAKGHQKVDMLNEFMDLYPRSVSEAINGNDQLRHPSPHRFDVRLFKSLEKAIGPRLAYEISNFVRRAVNFTKRKFGK